MDIETKKYFRESINKLDTNCNLVNEIIFDEYLQDDDEFMQISEAIDQLQMAITNYQEYNNYI